MKILKKMVLLWFMVLVIVCCQMSNLNGIVYGVTDESAGEATPHDDPSEDTSAADDPVTEEPSQPSAPVIEEPSEPNDDSNSSSETQKPASPDDNSSSSNKGGNTSASHSSSSSSKGSSSSKPSDRTKASSSSGRDTDDADDSSVDTKLSELSINCGQLVPEFSPEQYNYKVYVEYKDEPINCGTTGVPVDPSVTLRAEGPLESNGEDVEKHIFAESKDGNYSEYVIEVHIVKDDELLIDGHLYTISDPKDMDLLPGTFVEKEVEFDSKTVMAVESSDGGLCLLCYVNADDENDILWYKLNEKNGDVSPASIIEFDGQRYISLSSGNDLVYGEHEGTTGYFLIDPETGEVILSLNDGKEKSDTGTSSANIILVIAVAAIVALCVIFCLLMYRKYSLQAKKNKDTDNRYFRPYLSPDEEYTSNDSKVKL